MSMDSFMNGHLFSLDDYASPISTLYLSATHSITPVTRDSELPRCVLSTAFPKGKEHNVNGFEDEWAFVLS